MRFPAGRWKVETLAVGGELQPTLEGPLLTLEVSDGGDVRGNTGINRFSSRIEDGPRFGPLTTTTMSGPHALVAQERIYLKHLEAVDGFEVEEGGINLVARGLIVVTLQGLGGDAPGYALFGA